MQTFSQISLCNHNMVKHNYTHFVVVAHATMAEDWPWDPAAKKLVDGDGGHGPWYLKRVEF